MCQGCRKTRQLTVRCLASGLKKMKQSDRLTGSFRSSTHHCQMIRCLSISPVASYSLQNRSSMVQMVFRYAWDFISFRVTDGLVAMRSRRHPCQWTCWAEWAAKSRIHGLQTRTGSSINLGGRAVQVEK